MDFFLFLGTRGAQLHVYEGKDQLRRGLETYFEVEGFDQVMRAVVVRDCNGNPEAAIQSVWGQWATAFKVQEPKVAPGVWHADPTGREWSVWLIPDPTTPGDLEELLWRAVPQSPHRDCTEEMIECLEKNSKPVPYGARTKARLYAWLGTQENPIKEFYAAFDPTNKLFDAADPAFADIVKLLDQL